MTRLEFLRLHRECCIEFGNYAAAMQTVQELTGSLHQRGLGGNPEAENWLRKLLIVESPVKVLRRNGLDVTHGWGWDLSTDVIPLVQKYPQGE